MPDAPWLAGCGKELATDEREYTRIENIVFIRVYLCSSVAIGFSATCQAIGQNLQQASTAH